MHISKFKLFTIKYASMNSNEISGIFSTPEHLPATDGNVRLVIYEKNKVILVLEGSSARALKYLKTEYNLVVNSFFHETT